jgi:hypothetical protein
MEHHLREDHPQPVMDQAPTIQVAETVRPTAPTARLDAGPSGPAARRKASRRIVGILLTIAAVLLVAYAAVYVSIPSAVIAGGILLVLSVIYVRSLGGARS